MRFPHVRTQERFIVDVLENFTPIQSYYKLIKTVEDDPEFDSRPVNPGPNQVDTATRTRRLSPSLVLPPCPQECPPSSERASIGVRQATR